MKIWEKKRQEVFRLLFWSSTLVALYLTTFYSYLLFHTMAELFSITIAFSFFVIVFNTRQYIKNSYLLYIGIAYFFVAFLDLLHTLAYKGMNVFEGEHFFANQIWIATRYIESISLLVGLRFLQKNRRVNVLQMLAIYSLITGLLLLSIFHLKIFPECFVKGQGQTPFKIVSEFVVMIILGINIFLLTRQKAKFSPPVFRMLIFSLTFTIISELAFTFYIDNYGISNLIGHYFKLFSYYLIYKSVIEIGLTNPFALLFKEIKQNEHELKELNATKDRFFSIVAHDLKNPFNTLLGFSEMLLAKHKQYTPEKRERYIGYMHTNLKNSYTLLENLLQWSRSQSGRLKMYKVSFNVNLTIETTIEQLSANISAKKIRISKNFDQPAFVVADENMVRTVVRNLLSNALKFSYSGSEIRFSTKVKQENVEIRIRDYGIGIAPENIEKLFRIDQSITTQGTDKEQGTGLGLILCKEFVEKNHGQIGVESTPAEGSEFFFTLPKATENKDLVSGTTQVREHLALDEDFSENALSRLETEVLPYFQQLEKKFSNSAANNFARKIIFVSQELQSPLLKKYGHLFLTHLDKLDIDAMQTCLRAFAPIAEKLKARKTNL